MATGCQLKKQQLVFNFVLAIILPFPMNYLNRYYPLDNADTPSLWDQLSFWSSPFGKLLMDHVPMRIGMDVLDVGCGAGFPLLELAQCLGPKSKLTGLDIWKEGMERTSWKKDKMGLSNVELIVTDGKKMPFREDRFDLIVSNLGINNFDDPPAVMLECHRVLKRKGRICITTNLEGHFMEFYKIFANTLKEKELKELLPQLKSHEHHRGTDETVRELFENAGFSIVKMLRQRFQMRFVDGTALLNHLLIIVGFLPAWRSIIPQEKEKSFFESLEKNLNEQAKWDGELKMTVPMLYVEAEK